MNKLKKKIEDAFNAGKINEYMKNRLMNSVDEGVDEDMLDDAVADAEMASDDGVKEDLDYNIRFVMLVLADDISKDTFGKELTDEEKRDLTKYVLSLDDKEEHMKDLLGIRILIHRWLKNKSMDKKSYINYPSNDPVLKEYSVDKWVSLAKEIYMAIKAFGLEKDYVISKKTEGWDADERYRFIRWLDYYSSDADEKYNIKMSSMLKSANFLDQFSLDRTNTPPSILSGYKVKEDVSESKKRKSEELLKTKRKMKGRLKSLWNLVHKFNEILPKGSNIDDILKIIHNLDISISRLQTEAGIKNCIVRTASIFDKRGFHKGSELLNKMADGEDNLEIPNKMGVSQIIDKMEIISKMLKSREMIRELARVDIMLSEIGIASYFPELGDAQSKLNDAFSYAANKVEGILAKLRGGEEIAKVTQPKTQVPSRPQSLPEQQPAPLTQDTPIKQAPQSDVDIEDLRSAPVKEPKTDILDKK